MRGLDSEKKLYKGLMQGELRIFLELVVEV